MTTLIVCAPGCSSHLGRSGLAAMVNMVRKEAPPGVRVVDAYLREQQPTLADVIAETTGQRIVVPVLLGHDDRLLADIDAAVGARRDVLVTAPVGPDWPLAEVSVQRMIEAGARPSDTIVMLAETATGERAVEDLGKAARLLSAVWGGRVHVGAMSGVGPPVADTLDIARAYGKRIVVSVYAWTSEHLARELAALGADVVTAPLVGPQVDQRLVDTVLARAFSRGSWARVAL